MVPPGELIRTTTALTRPASAIRSSISSRFGSSVISPSTDTRAISSLTSGPPEKRMAMTPAITAATRNPRQNAERRHLRRRSS